MRNPIARLLIA